MAFLRLSRPALSRLRRGPLAAGLAIASLLLSPAGSPAQLAPAPAPTDPFAAATATPAAPATTPPPAAPVDPLTAAQDAFRHGDYEGALAAAEQGCTDDVFNDEWWRLRGRALLTLGRYADAHIQLARGVRYVPESIRLLLLLREASLDTSHPDEAEAAMQQVNNILGNRARTAVADPVFLVSVGEAALVIGAEPKLVLENFLKPGLSHQPPLREAAFDIGQLALDKHDFALAARNFNDGTKLYTADPDMFWGLAAAFEGSGDNEQFLGNAAHALELNPRHIPTLLLLAEHLIDSEEHALARETLQKILAINPLQPDALALLAVLAHLENHPDQAADLRAKALSTWKTNPKVDFTIGRKLSQNYRFREGAAAQRQALAFDDNFTPARIQLAQDLLRLGQSDEGWSLAAQAHKADGYDVEAYNLVTLHDHLDTYTSVEDDHFLVRMAGNEAPIYGQRALALLEQARTKLTAKYGLDLTQKTTIEIYSNPGDFAVRTFGVPGVVGFLGVCFGSVITVNSPATSSANWESVLWHEFTHVITLTITQNKMPRWLSEGISVYEEAQANPGWGQMMSLSYRDSITEGKMEPMSKMSAAFLTATDPRQIGFAYFQSMLVVKFLVDHYGFDHLKATLRALGTGMDINEALQRNFGPLDELDKGFAEYARAEAKRLGGDFDLTRPDPEAGTAAAALAQLDPRNFYSRVQQIQALMTKEDWAGAKAKLTELTASGLYLRGPENPLMLLATCCHKLGDIAGEKAALTTVAVHEGDAMDPVTRLLAMATADKDWPAVSRWAEAWLAINPLAAAPWRALLTTHEQRQEAPDAIQAARVLLQLDPPDEPNIHYRLARQLQIAGDTESARRHVLQALEDAPRFRAAYELLATLPPEPAAPAEGNAAPGTTPATKPSAAAGDKK
jgi:tetratricopeptide (TPR) repeat protein